MDGNEKRRGRRLFASRRRQEERDVTPSPEPDEEDPAVTGGSISPEVPDEAASAPVSVPPASPPRDEETLAAAGPVATAEPPAVSGSVHPQTSPGEVESEMHREGESEPADEAVEEAQEESVAESMEDAGTEGGATSDPVGFDDDEDLSYELPRIVAIANQKGGVGKTTTSVNLGASLAELGYRVLVVDLDPQGNASTGLGINARNLSASIYDVIMNDAAIEDCVEPTSLKNLFLAPATIDLAGAEIELVPAFSRELKLRRALEAVRDDYDYMIIDCPPSLGLLTVNGLAAADDVVVPIQCEYYALEGLSQLVRNVELVRSNLNPKLDVRGIVLTMYDARTKLADQVEQEVREHFGRRVYQTVVPRTVRLSEAPSFGQPIILFDPTSRGAVAYRELAKEVSSGATRRAG